MRPGGDAEHGGHDDHTVDHTAITRRPHGRPHPARSTTVTTIIPDPIRSQAGRSTTATRRLRRIAFAGGVAVTALFGATAAGIGPEPSTADPPSTTVDGTEAGAGQLRLTWLIRPRPAVHTPTADA
jgi:hypothetical protein